MSQDTKTCPYCAETINAAATVCRFCNKELHSSFRLSSGNGGCGCGLVLWILLALFALGILLTLLKQPPKSSPPAEIKQSMTQTTPPSGSPESNSSVPLVLSGRGNKATKNFLLHRGLVVFDYSVKNNTDALLCRPTNFIVALISSDGTTVDNVVNEIGKNLNGSQAIQIEESGNYVLNIQAQGSWKFTIAQ